MSFDEEIPYRSPAPVELPSVDRASLEDEANFSTLRAVRRELGAALAELDKWHAFDLEEKENMNIKQQIKAHQLAYNILAPLVDALDSAMESVNRKYREG